jgi:1,4-alpha-glucan branching enzyme
LTEHDVYFFKEGSHDRLYDKLGAHLVEKDGVQGTHFAVWAPNAKNVSVIGDFNKWTAKAHPLKVREDGSGIWEGFIPEISKGAAYKYHIESRHKNYRVDKGDPLAFCWEMPPKTASTVWDLSYEWGDTEWMKNRKTASGLTAPLSIYEVHLGSWRRVPKDGNRSLNYRELAHRLVEYVQEMGFTQLYLDYSRKEGEWISNEFGGRENIEAINFLKKFNEAVYREHPDVQTIAEESTAWPMVSRPVYVGGLGFGMKWNMGWMHDTLEYFSKESIHRKYHHNQLTFSILYAFSENFVLSLSHDEVVHGKGSLLGKMPGDDWQKLANLRALLGYMYGHPGKKLLFMGAELGQWSEWTHDGSLDWHLLQSQPHQGMHQWMKDLNRFYRSEPALYEIDFGAEGFEWIDASDWGKSIISFLRKSKRSKDFILVACNFTPVPRHNYRVGVPRGGFWKEALNSDARTYGGSGQGNLGGLEASPLPAHGKYYSLSLTLPPLSVVFFKCEEQSEG